MRRTARAIAAGIPSSATRAPPIIHTAAARRERTGTMSSAGINFGGLASGLDTQAIISALMAVERRPIQAMEAKKTSLGRQKSLFGDLEKLLADLKNAGRALKTTTDFLAMRAASDDEDVLTASAGNSAASGTYRVDVERLATAEVRAAVGRASKTSPDFGAGTLQFDIDGDTEFVSFNNGSLEDIAAAINAKEGLDIAAEVIDTGNSNAAERYQLIIRSTKTGAEGDFTVSVDTGGPALDTLIAEINGAGGTGTTSGLRTAAADAHILLNGIDVFRSSNTVTDAIPGVTLNLKSENASGSFVTVTVSTDGEATSEKVQEFVDAYNKVVDFMLEQGQVDGEGKAKSALFGDITLRSIRSALRTEVGTVVDTGNLAYTMFAQIGITSETSGKLTFNRSKFEEALGTDEVAVGRIFANGTNGVASKVIDRIEIYTDSVEGLIKARKDGFDTLSRTTQTRIDQAERRLGMYEIQLKQRFANLESMLSQLQGQGGALGGLNRG
ncbi:MAG: flagellar filament capping protein FliD [Planctomycetes bacterium]|nr:flagellar filament capping protein FliD [Planctomycetota bacterium]